MPHGVGWHGVRDLRHRLLGHYVHGVDGVWDWGHTGTRVYDGRRELYLLDGLGRPHVCGV